tara:strand:+ start:286 stop:726 length:441 start_codon:yes stop_codon:yes gene_type:complete
MSLQDKNPEIENLNKKIQDLKNERLLFKLKKYIDEKDFKKMKNLEVNATYDYTDSDQDEYAHWMNATLSVEFKLRQNKNEKIIIKYSEEQGCHTEDRYSPTVTCNYISCTTNAKKLLFKKLDIDMDDIDNDDWYEIVGMIKDITSN